MCLKEHLASVVLVVATIAQSTQARLAATDEDDESGPSTRLVAFAPITIDSAAFRPTAEEQQRIKSLIESLTSITEKGQRVPEWLNSSPFTVIAGSRTATTWPGRRQAEFPDAVIELVRFGPKAIPMLLESLEEPTPTQIEIDVSRVVNISLLRTTNIHFNLASPREAAVRAAHPSVGKAFKWDPSHELQQYTVTRGDLCITILGHIVNRNYTAIQYVGKIVALNSPVQNPEVATIVRQLWASNDPAQLLFESLMTDLHTRSATPNLVDEPQCGAATRLLYYFPDESAPLIAERLNSLAVRRITTTDEDWEEQWQRQAEQNGVGVSSFVNAVSYSHDRRIQKAALGVLQRTDDPFEFVQMLNDDLVANAPELIFDQLKSIWAAAPPFPSDWRTGTPEIHVVRAAVTYFPEKARHFVEEYASHGTMAKVAAIGALNHPKRPVPWAVEYLAPLLDDRTTTQWQYGPSYDRQPMLVCDRAAEVISSHLQGMTFKLEGERHDLDRQIAAIKRQLGGGQPEPEKSFENEVPWEIAPSRVVSIPALISTIYSNSNSSVVVAGVGYAVDGEPCGWALDVYTIATESSRVLLQNRIGLWSSGISTIHPTSGEVLLCYHGRDGGEIVARQLQTGLELKRLRTPFHQGIGLGNPLQVRNTGDLCASFKGDWVFAMTCDGSLHVIDLVADTHEVVWKRQGEPRFKETGYHATILPVEYTSKVLVQFLFEEDPLRLWDQTTRTMTDLPKLPPGGWVGAWGEVALNTMNGHYQLWDLHSRRRISMPAFDQKIRQVVVDRGQSTAFVLLESGVVAVLALHEDQTSRWVATLAAPTPMPDEWPAIVLSSDGHVLFWHARYAPQNAGDQHQLPPPSASTIYVYQVADTLR